MNLLSTPTSHPRSRTSYVARHGHVALLAALTVGLVGNALADDRPLPGTDNSTEPVDGPTDLRGERHEIDPADDFWWEPPFERPGGADDLQTDASSGQVWLTAAAPNQAGAYMSGQRVWNWDANPAEPIWQFRVDPERPIEMNAELALHLRAQPGYRYDVYFWFGPGPDMHGSSVRINNDLLDIHPQMQPEGSGWTALNGPPPGEAPVNHIISLDLAGLPDDGEARWSVTAVQIVSTPMR